MAEPGDVDDDLVAILRKLRLLEIEGEAFGAGWAAWAEDLHRLCVNGDKGVAVEQEGAFDQSDGFVLGNRVGDHDGEFRAGQVGIADHPLSCQLLVDGENLGHGCVGELHGDFFFGSRG